MIVITSIQVYKDAKDARLAAGFYGHLVTLYSVLAESRIFNRITHPRFIKSFELGINDCSLVVSPDLIPGKTSTDRIFALRQDRNSCLVVVSLEVKYASIQYDGSGNAFYHFGVTPDQ